MYFVHEKLRWALKLACGAAFGLAVSNHYVESAWAESETSEQWRLERLNKTTGGRASFGTKTTSTFHGGGGPAVTETEIIVDKAQIPMLTPKGDSGLLVAQTKYSAIVAQGGFPKVPNGTYKKGAEGKGVAILNARLNLEGYLRAEGTLGDVASIYTSATEDAVIRYQRNMGLAASGRVDNATLAELNVSADQRLRTISANIPRLAIYEKGLGDRYVIVNVPAQQIETVTGGHVFSRHNAIVGRPERPSPVVMTPLDTVKFNPYWNAPVSIVERDIIPKMQANPQLLTSMNMKVFQGVGGPEVDPKSIDWSHAVPDDYQFRQEPGPENAMKTAKIEFNSPFGIYLHDTAEPQLFRTNNRFYSSGCIRVDKMPALVEWVLNGQDGFGSGKISSMAETLERLDVKIAAPPQLRVAYLTAWPTANGTIAFRRDIYDLDATGFTVGQPMPVGEKSPDGLRYVLKPLPRQVPIDTAEADGFHLFGARPSTKLGDPLAAKKNLFGKALFATKSDSAKAVVKKVSVKSTDVAIVLPDAPTADATSPLTSKKLKSKSAKVGVKKETYVGLFDWVAYRKKQAGEARGVKVRISKKKATIVQTATADTAKVKVDTKKTKVDNLATTDAQNKLTAKAPKKVAALSDPCAPVNGKIPADCKPKKP
jgi:L,D-transpeptidase YcbB